MIEDQIAVTLMVTHALEDLNVLYAIGGSLASELGVDDLLQRALQETAPCP